MGHRLTVLRTGSPPLTLYLSAANGLLHDDVRILRYVTWHGNTSVINESSTVCAHPIFLCFQRFFHIKNYSSDHIVDNICNKFSRETLLRLSFAREFKTLLSKTRPRYKLVQTTFVLSRFYFSINFSVYFVLQVFCLLFINISISINIRKTKHYIKMIKIVRSVCTRH